ncbi:MAG: penicillin-binding protein 2 [Candidatus Limnocylindria bacterium]|nr:penicillin-binding protein 2 [Candidatus Limnocylindria bacterium]
MSVSYVRPRRFAALALALVAVLVLLTVRLYDLQIVRGTYFRELAEQNRVLRLPVVAERGVVLDRNRHVLVRNLPGFAVSVIPVDVPVAREAELAERLGRLVGRDPGPVRLAIQGQRLRNPFEPVRVSLKPIARETALLIAERNETYPGVRIDPESLREYVDGSLYAPIVGYIGPITEEELAARRETGYLPDDDIGRTGVERVYERYLRGTYGAREIERDAAQREIKTLALVPPRAGGNLVLTLDDRLQKLLAAELERGVAADQFSQAVGIAMDPQNGEILAMVSTPSYDNNLFVRGITAPELQGLLGDDRHPLVNKAIGEIYPPGSTFKLVTGVAALSEGVATRSTVVNVDRNFIEVGPYKFFDWQAHGRLDFIGGFANSSDIYFYTLGGGNLVTGQRGVGPEAIGRYGRMLGFGAPTGIDLPGEAAGIMPDPVWKEDVFDEPWTIGNTYQEAIGQGYVAVTPLQLLNAYAAIANGGTLYRPHVLREVLDDRGTATVVKQPEVVRKLDITPENLQLLREASRRVVTIGHAAMPNTRLPIAGKTGTAEFGPSAGKDSAGRNLLGFHNWFVSFVPEADDNAPTARIAMVIFTFNSSKNLCELCLNPAIGISQRIYEAYLGAGTTAP